MTRAERFRQWARWAPIEERIIGPVAIAAALAAILWLAIPGGKSSTSVASSTGGSFQSGGSSQQVNGTGAASSANSATATGGATGGTSSGVTGGAQGGGAVSPGSGNATVGGHGGSQTAVSSPSFAGAGCASPPGSAPGVTANDIKVAVTLTQIVGPAGNNTFGLPTPQQQQAYYQAVIDSLNASGGVACRRVVPTYYQVNPADQSNLQQSCLTIVQSGAYAAIDFTGFAGSTPQGELGPACFAQNGVPFFENYFEDATAVTQFYPYLFALNTYESLYHNTVFGLRDQGFFSPSKGFRKLGFVYRDCFPGLINDMTTWLKDAGLSSSQIVTYDLGCPAAFATPSDIEQAILKFQQNGVTNVTWGLSTGDFSNFTTISEQQNFHPKYGIGDDGTVNLSYGNQHPNYSNIANAIAITASRYGEEHTPGMAPSPATAKCNAIYKAAGQEPVYQQPIGAGGNICDQLWMFAAALDHAPTVARTALAAGLAAAGSVDYSYPQGPNSFTGSRITFGGEYWRTDQFLENCSCWQVVDQTFRPSYTGS